MSDMLLELSKNPQARRFIDSLGLPLSLPEPLRRPRTPYHERPLSERTVAAYGGGSGELTSLLARSIIEAGADVIALDGEEALAHYKGPAEAWARSAELGGLEAPRPDQPVRALVMDATGLDTPVSLRKVYDFFHGWLTVLERGGRALVLSRPPESTDAVAVATRAALEGFVKSVAKELGRRGATANLLYVERGAEERAPAVIRFLLSDHSAFVTAQPLRVTRVARPNRSVGWTHALKSKTALVTGAGRGIGEAIALRLGEEGAHVVCVDRPEQDGPVSRVARQVGGSVLLLDIAAADAGGKVVDALRQRGGVDIVVHNAGVTRDKTLAKMPPEMWNETLAVNLGAPVSLTRAMLDAELLHDEGRVVLLSSVSGIAGNAGQTNYAASKAGLIGFARSLAQQVAARGITVNCVAPGFIETEMTAKMPGALREVARRLSALGQGGQPVDVAEAVAFLSMPWSDGLTGATLRVCGGAFIGA